MKIIREFDISEDQMTDLLVAAFEGGINYWCGEVRITAMPPKTTAEELNMGLMASEVVPKGGTVAVFDIDEPCRFNSLTREKMLVGISKAMTWGGFVTVEDLMAGHDAETADVIVQYALFGEIVFG